MTFWTTFTPQKICWELSCIKTRGKAATGNWLDNRELINQALKDLKQAGITGIRLVIFPEEVTIDGKNIHWQPIEIMLLLCQKNGLAVDLCIGPYQYPNYPGIYLPKELLRNVFEGTNSLDTRTALQLYGKTFLESQLARYGEDKRIRGFHIANEWPDKQHVKGKEQIKTFVSTDFMLWAVKAMRKKTEKPISLNTNIDASDRRRLANTFGEIAEILEDQGRIGFDIYPSQETWTKAFFHKLRRIIEPYHKSYQWSCRRFSLCEMYFCEVEAQPWGSGQSWYRMITQEPNPEQKILNYNNTSLQHTFEKYIKKSGAYEVSLWGADFWLSAALLGVHWPLIQVKALARQYGS